jgi:GDP-mannose 6-dehydrogenase
MRTISVFGLGYVGTVTAACLATKGYRVIGVDVAAEKVEAINKGQSPIIEAEIDDVVMKAVKDNRLRATSNSEEAVAASELAIVCVGTPSADNNSLDTTFVQQVTEHIGQAIRITQKRNFVFVLRSTVLPGTTRNTVVPILEQTSGRKAGDGYDVAFHPEFLREGSSVRDFYSPPKIVIGERVSGGAAELESLYEGIEAPRILTGLEVAELVKYADNSFHAVKITFANEIGQLCKQLGIDSRAVMEIFCSDRQLNISPAYLRPGFAFGGSCLPKDVRALVYQAKHSDLNVPLLESLLPSNQEQVERVARTIQRSHPANIGLVGLAFKPGTDDLRESPLVSLAERLLGKGFALRIFDPNVETSRLVGRNLAYIERHLPHLSRLLISSLDDFCECDFIVVGHPVLNDEVVNGWLAKGKKVLDLTGKLVDFDHSGFDGLFW